MRFYSFSQKVKWLRQFKDPLKFIFYQNMCIMQITIQFKITIQL